VNVAPGTGQTVQSLVKGKVKHVFVLIQENHTFDNYFGLYPGTNGQSVENLASSTAQALDCVPDPQTGGCQRPFLISANPNSPSYVVDAPDITGGNNGRYDQQASINRGAMNGFLADVDGRADRGPQRVDRHHVDLRLRHGAVLVVLREELHALRSLLPSDDRRLDAQ
jgi:phospholipase C